MMHSIPIQEAVGQVLAHDVTRIVPGQAKGPAFKKGSLRAGGHEKIRIPG